ncbi:MAG: hypothetical protein ACXVFN_05320 [Solirubrobacteraceae bacterium]
MSISRLPLVALLACLAAMLIAGPARAQGTFPSFTKKVAVTGKAANGKAFKGTYTITRFKSVGGKTYAVGTLTGTVKNRKVTRSNVAIPVTLAGAPGGARSAQVASCKVLTLTLGPLDLNLLGLRVQLNQVNLLITAIPGGGLLGDLLCGITNALNPSGLLGQQLAAVLNAILALVPATPAP